MQANFRIVQLLFVVITAKIRRILSIVYQNHLHTARVRNLLVSSNIINDNVFYLSILSKETLLSQQLHEQHTVRIYLGASRDLTGKRKNHGHNACTLSAKHLPSRWRTQSAYQQYRQASVESHERYLDLSVLTVPTELLRMFACETWFVLFDSWTYQHKVPLNWHLGK